MLIVYCDPYITEPNSRDIDTIQVSGCINTIDGTVDSTVKCFKKCYSCGWKEITIDELCERIGAKG